MTENRDVIKQVAALPTMSAAKLKTMWRELFDSDPPPYTKPFLVKRLAYRLQELAYGGLSKEVAAKLSALAKDESKIGRAASDVHRRPVVGTRLIREWKGVEHCVTVMADGFEYMGQPYRSLSAVARAITGTRWNGWKFFNIQRHPQGGRA